MSQLVLQSNLVLVMQWSSKFLTIVKLQRHLVWTHMNLDSVIFCTSFLLHHDVASPNILINRMKSSMLLRIVSKRNHKLLPISVISITLKRLHKKFRIITWWGRECLIWWKHRIRMVNNSSRFRRNCGQKRIRWIF